MSDSQQSESSSTEQGEKARKKRYKKSLNLPKTAFPMRANLAQNEPQTRKRWEKAGLFENIMESRADAPVFAFHDGPPFANGSIHVGHLLNKVLKDIVVRSRLGMGEQCRYVPGWDCHGLPIEHKVVGQLMESGKMAKLDTLDVNTRRLAIRSECQRYAEKFKKLQAEQMKRLLTLADYDDPYLTMKPSYERAVLEVFAGLVEQGIVYRDLKPVHWSIANETALADAELEYQNRVDPSIYVCFDFADSAAVAKAFGVKFEDITTVSLMIWTTTPWTLPANRLVAVHEDFDYSLVRVGERLTVIASELVANVAAIEEHTAQELARVKGSALVDLRYLLPLADPENLETSGIGGTGHVVLGEHVTLEDGTGLVHTAPGHGREDFDTGIAAGLEAYCPVRGDGTYDSTVVEWLRGVSVWDANPKVLEHLRTVGTLYHHHDFDHSYPHDWRSKTPVIFRTTEQWFIAVDEPTVRERKSLRQLALDATANDIRFIPAWGENRMRGMLESRPDWCISRQRAWGLPIPAFRTDDGKVLLTPATVRAVGSVYEREGSDAWFKASPTDLLASWDPATDGDLPEELAGVKVEALEKMYDIFDVWLESGSSWNAVMRERGLGYPTDLYLEGSDQHRGWFQLSMLPALGVTGMAPFKRVLTHGFMVDKKGHKMSKSLGNALNVEDLLAQHGADVLRWWVSSLAFENDIKVDPTFFEVAGESYRKVRNTLRFLLSNLNDFDPSHNVGDLDPASLDAWAMKELAALRDGVIAAYDNYQFRQAHQLLFDFCNDTLSSFYLDAVKDRLYCDPADSQRRRATQRVLWRLADTLVCLLAPILPHTAEEAHSSLHADAAADATKSVHMRAIPEVASPALDEGWSHLLALREQVSKALEAAKADGLDNPLDAGVKIHGEIAERFLADLPDILGVSRVEFGGGEGALEIIDLRQEPRCERSWRRDSTVKERSDGGWLSDRDAEAVGLS